MTSKRRENINLVSFICLSFLVISFSKQLLIIYTSELILCSTICVPSRYAAQHSYVPLLSLRRDSPSKIVPDFLCDLVAQSAE